MGQNNNDQLLRDAFRAIADGQKVMIQAMQVMMARLEVQNRIQPIRREERGEIDGYGKKGFENFEEPSFWREQQRRDVGLPREFKQPPYDENQNRREASLRVEIPEFKGGMNLDDFADWTLSKSPELGSDTNVRVQPIRGEELPLVLVPPRATSFCDLPADVVINILSRLPVKTLVSSTSVSKEWCSLIKNSSFISTHLARSVSELAAIDKTQDISELAAIDKTQDTGNGVKGCILITPKVCSEKPILSICYDDKSCTPHSAVEIPFETCSRTVAIVGSCNGLVCLTDAVTGAFGGDVYLYNPVVRKYRKLSKEFSCCVDWMGKGSATYPVLGFGYHEGDKDYKVVRILYSFHNVHQKLRPRAEVYGLRQNKWTSVKAPIKSTANRGCTTFLDGCLYWFGFTCRERDPPQGAYIKLKPKKIGPCQVLEKCGDDSSLRASFSEEGESDEDSRSNTSVQPSTPLMDSWSKRL